MLPSKAFLRQRRARRSPAMSFLCLPLELLNEGVSELVLKFLTSQVNVTSSGLELECNVLNAQKHEIEGITAQIDEKNAVCTRANLVKPICNCSSRRADESNSVEASYCCRIPRNLTL